MIARAEASPPVLQIDAYVWRRALPTDAATFEALAAHGTNRIVFNLPRSADEFAVRMGGPTFGQPMLCLRRSTPVGAAGTTSRNRRSLNLQLACFFVQPARAVLPLAGYLRHLFWAMPIHRVYVQLPAVVGVRSYVRLFREVGFAEEGVVRGHALVGGRPRDVVALGILRKEFEAWCAINESRLAL